MECRSFESKPPQADRSPCGARVHRAVARRSTPQNTTHKTIQLATPKSLTLRPRQPPCTHDDARTPAPPPPLLLLRPSIPLPALAAAPAAGALRPGSRRIRLLDESTHRTTARTRPPRARPYCSRRLDDAPPPPPPSSTAAAACFWALRSLLCIRFRAPMVLFNGLVGRRPCRGGLKQGGGSGCKR